ncbi:E3 ubiquitin-protein ligase-like protein [Hapsidospora chrysogenum ATCC 11550]|uniref:E3 ubiquitin protein ligase n=1 Tax=Hapsidospora chrysogenum (strain ATCC 11550 / CBS 779.69 / DSM 880 / IAM 14645 / JCM 23072 / IMI 49137) TaxID=857340 RepID=A0A086TFM7_HAPC1|nr:E3 ubiquitin-protein ligase-like protein [Hapsidospora chrysogenum ATCC 11550]
MPAATTLPASSRPSTTNPKMEERKRPAVGSADELAPPSKRLAVNGSKHKDDALEMKEESWVETYTKGAIYRQMQEYSRRATTAESRLEELHKRSVHHDDHLRIIDAWWLQILEEMELLAESKVSTTSSASGPPYLTGVTFKDLQEFHNHIQEKGKTIKTKAEALLNRLSSARGDVSPEAAKLEGQINSLLAAQKEYLLKLDRLSSEKDQLSEELNTATLRYFKAEKKLDRAKSAQVQKMEQQAFANATRPAPGSEGSEPKEATNGNSSELLLKYEETTAAANKQKEQLDNLLAEIKTVSEENSALKARREALTDEDFIRTDVFKQFKAQNEDLIKRINNLEATNKQLREEAEKLQAERSAFRTQLEADANQVTQELEAEIVARDQDLSRVRSARDEILAENTQRKASMDQEKAALEQMKGLSAAKDDRISALESEISRLKPSEDEQMADLDDAEELSLEDLRTKYKKLQTDFQSINQELPSIEKAYRKMKDLAQKKVMDFAALEERNALLIAEKSKADQKYFAARKDADTRNNEIRSLRHQNGKSAEIIAQLKDHESQNRTLLSNLEKQISDLKQTNSSLATECRRLETNSQEAARRVDSLNKQIGELTNLVKSKDSASAVVRERNAMQEVEVEKLKVRLDNMQKDRDSWKSKALSNSSEEEEMLRAFALCTICRSNFKNTALKTCGHLFCNQCIEDRITNRMRKCPTCSRSFDKMDVMPVHV